MKITSINAIPLYIPYVQPYYWSQGVTTGAEVLLISIEGENGMIGYGECISTPTASGVKAFVDEAAKIIIGQSIFQKQRMISDCYQSLFQFRGNCSAPRFGSQIFSGIEMALWDLQGKVLNISVCDMLGGAVRDSVAYFGFVQGSTPDELASDAVRFVDRGHNIIYCKVGRGNYLDIEIVKRIREAIGSSVRLRLDPNEAWDPLTAIRMIKSLEKYDIEFVEQPCDHRNIFALKQIKEASSIPIAADQCVFNAADVYNVIKMRAADLITLGLHETGGITSLVKAAAVAEVGGLNICLKGLYESGVTTCAAHQVGLALTNLDDGNQYMNHLLTSDIISAPDLSLKESRLGIFDRPGLGFEINLDSVARASEQYQSKTSQGA